jgi:SNF2 family DNA or RNA helicase
MLTLKKAPFQHQATEIEKWGTARHRGLFWEMGCAKTQPMLVEAAQLYEAGEINGLVVIAPNGVHRCWINDQIPDHLPLEVEIHTKAHMWQTSKSKTTWHAEAANALLKHDGMSVLAMSYHAMMTEVGRKFLKSFMQQRTCFTVMDESPAIKSPAAKTTIRAQAMSHWCPYRRILSGTLVDDRPFDVYAQLRFLDENCWSPLGIKTPAEFRSYFGVFEKRRAGKQEWEALVRYKNLNELKEVIHQYGTHYLKKDVLPNLPPKLYSKRYFEMTPEQARIYKELREDFQTFLSSGECLTAPLAGVRLIRLRQVLSGYMPTDTDTNLVPIGDKNPRLDLLSDVVEDAGGSPLIIWAVYTEDIDQILRRLAHMGINAVRYDGKCSDTQLFSSLDRFRSGEAKCFVSHPAVGGQGLTLVEASSMIWYNNPFKLSFRRQGEDRNHRPGQKAEACNIIDLCAAGTVDELVIRCLREKQEVVDYVMGDPKTIWI